MAFFTISTLAGRVLAELPLDEAVLDLVVCDLLERLPPPQDGSPSVRRLLLGPRELGWSERLADLALAPGSVLTLGLVQDAERAAADLLGAYGTPVRLAAARALHATGAAAAGQAEAALFAVLSDPDAEVVGEALRALRSIGAAVEPASVKLGVEELERLAKIAQDLEDPSSLVIELRPSDTFCLARRLNALLALCDGSPGQWALRSRTILRRLAPLHWEAARRYEPLLTEPLDDPRPEVRLAAVPVLAGSLVGMVRVPGFLVGMVRVSPEDAADKLFTMLQCDTCLGVRCRAAAALGSARWKRPIARSVALARAALAAEVEALRTSALPADRFRIEAVQSLQQLLG